MLLSSYLSSTFFSSSALLSSGVHSKMRDKYSSFNSRTLASSVVMVGCRSFWMMRLVLKVGCGHLWVLDAVALHIWHTKFAAELWNIESVPLLPFVEVVTLLGESTAFRDVAAVTDNYGSVATVRPSCSGFAGKMHCLLASSSSSSIYIDNTRMSL